MRTCPACGEDTDAGYAEPCTECGASATGDPAPEPPLEPAEAPTGPAEPPAEPSEPPPGPEEGRRSPSRLLVWLVAIAGFGGLYALGVFDGATGPSAGEVEEAIAESAPEGVTVDCPESAEDTPVGETFTCTATGPNGRTAEVVVTNNEDSFEWNPGPLTTLS